MSTIDALGAALSGLDVSQQLLNLTSNNVANANTPGYTAKTLPISTLLANGQLSGVTTDKIQRSVDTGLQSTYWSQLSSSSQFTTINSYLSKIQALYGTANTGTSFETTLGTVNNDFTQLSATPDSNVLQVQTVADAQTFANTLNQTASTVTKLRNNAETDITQSVSTINTQLQQIATLNTQIAQLTASGQSSANFADQRDSAVESLSGQMGITYFTRSDGVMVVQTSNGQPLADTTAHQLVFNSQPIGSTTTTTPGIYIDSATTGINLAPLGSAIGGTLGALVDLRDQILPGQQAQLDELAEQTANRFSAQGLKLFTKTDGTIPPNAPSSGYAGFASEITVNPAVTTDPSLVQQGTTVPVPPATALQPGDNTIIDNVLNYTFGTDQNAGGTPNVPFNTASLGANGNITTTLPATSTLMNYAQQILTTQANQASQYTSQGTFSSNYTTSLKTSLENGSSVNLDTEVANLTVYEHSYSAAAEVVSTVQKMMTDLLTAIQG